MALANVGARGEAEPAAEHARLVGKDVPEEVGGEEDINTLGLPDEPHRHGVHQAVVRRDARVPLRDLETRPPEHAAALPEDIRLVHNGDLPALFSRSELEGEPCDAFV